MQSWSSLEMFRRMPGVSPTSPSDEDAEIALSVASELLWRWSGRQFGVTRRTVRPEGCGCSAGWTTVVGWGLPLPASSWVGPDLSSIPGPFGGWSVGQCGGCHRWASGGVLLDGPVVWDTDNTIVVTVDGDVLDAADWSIVSGSLLIRTDSGVFPHCQNMKLATTELGTMSVTYSQGVAVPVDGQWAAAALAVEFSKLWGFTLGECQLPQRLRSITRQGVTAVAFEPMDLVDKGLTGISGIDYFIASVNPNRSMGAARVISPGFEYESPSVIAGSTGTF